MKNKKILVTGGCGYIGSHTSVELLNNDFEVIIVDNLSNSREEVVKSIEKITNKKVIFEKADLSIEKECKNIFDKYNIDGVINFAAFKAVGESVDKPIEYYKNNLGILLNVLDCMQQYNVKFFVQSSSCTVYGEPDKLPVTEESPIQKATSPYGHTKQIAEQMLDFITNNGKINAIALRYFNPIGAHPTALIGELPLGIPNNLMPYITQTAIGKRSQLKVFGNDYPTPDGTCIRDFIHVVDLAKAHVLALNRLLEQRNKESLEFFNVGTGKGYSVLEVINSFEKTGRKLDWTFAPRRTGDIIKIWADTTLSEKELGFKALEDLDSMTSSAWKWQLNLEQ